MDLLSIVICYCFFFSSKIPPACHVVCTVIKLSNLMVLHWSRARLAVYITTHAHGHGTGQWSKWSSVQRQHIHNANRLPNYINLFICLRFGQMCHVVITQTHPITAWNEMMSITDIITHSYAVVCGSPQSDRSSMYCDLSCHIDSNAGCKLTSHYKKNPTKTNIHDPSDWDLPQTNA